MPDNDLLNRLRLLARVIQRERTHLLATDQRIFAMPFSMARAQKLDTDVELAERVEAFVARFSRLQDTLGDKLLPALLRALGEPLGAVIDNLDRAERLGWLASLFLHQLRNEIIHEYVEDPAILANARQAGHKQWIPMLGTTSTALLTEIKKCGRLVDGTKEHSRTMPSIFPRPLALRHIKPLRDSVRFLLIIFKITTLYSPLKLFAPANAIFCSGMSRLR